MSEEKKYYTPRFEELHPFFEMEIKQDGTWKPYTIFEHSSLPQICIKVGADEVRVKCLDREDIESLGWQKGGLVGSGYFLKSVPFKSEATGMGAGSGMWMNQCDENSYQVIDCREEYHKTLFLGTIRNKSELKRLMKQLGI